MHFSVPVDNGNKATYSDLCKTLARTYKSFSYVDTAIGPDTFRLTGSSKRVRFGPGMGLMLSISIGTENVRGALVDANGWMLQAHDTPNAPAAGGPVSHAKWHAAELAPMYRQVKQTPAVLMDRIAAVASAVCKRALTDERLLVRGSLPLLGVSVAWPAPVDRAKALNGWTFDHWQWHSADAPPLTLRVAERLGLPEDRSHAVNDANAAAVAFAFDDIRRRPNAPTRTLLALHVGGGLGAGTCVVGSWGGPYPRSMFLATRLLEGDGGFAGELGHLPVAQHHVTELNELQPERGLEPIVAVPCACPRLEPCLQSYASATAFVERMVESGIVIEGLPEGTQRGCTSVMHQAARNATDRRQLRAKRDIGRMIGRALASPVLMLNPTMIAVSGAMAVPEVIVGIEDERPRWAPAHSERMRVIAVGDDPDPDHDQRQPPDDDASMFAAARGAALVVFRKHLYRRFDVMTPPFAGLTLPLDDDMVTRWTPKRSR